MIERLFFFGYPKDIGGASTEAYHTLKLFRQHGLDVTCVPTWGPVDGDWEVRLAKLGCKSLETSPELAPSIEGLAGGVILASCNTRFAAEAYRFREIGCKIIWQNCMCWPFPQMVLDHQRHGCFDRYVFHSKYQRDQLVPQLRKYGYRDEQGFLIRGAFFPGGFRYAPVQHIAGETFLIGRLSRRGIDKFPADLWKQYRRIPHPIWVSIMGWSDEVEDKCGPPPIWAEVFAERAKGTHEFLSSLHAFVPGFGACAENWPRVGLEAMAIGVPLVVEDQGGWREMVRDGQTGWLCQTPEEMAFRVAQLAYNETERLEMAYQARRALDDELAPPDAIWAGWKRLFDSLS